MSGADICDVATEYFTHDSDSESRPNATNHSLFTQTCHIDLSVDNNVDGFVSNFRRGDEVGQYC